MNTLARWTRSAHFVAALVILIEAHAWGQLAAGSYRRTMAAGAQHSVVLRDDGTVWACGANFDGQLGVDPAVVWYSPAPRQISGLAGIVAVAAGADHCLALSGSGVLYSWGRNAEGQLGRSGTAYIPAAVSLGAGSSVTGIAAGDNCSFVIRAADGGLFAFGDNTGTTLGLPNTVTYSTPTLVAGIANVVKVSTIGGITGAVTANRAIYMWGYGTGYNYSSLHPTPQQLTTISDAIDVEACSQYHNAIYPDTDAANDYVDAFFLVLRADAGLYKFVSPNEPYPAPPYSPIFTNIASVTGARHSQDFSCIRTDGSFWAGGTRLPGLPLASEVASGGEYFLRWSATGSGAREVDRGFLLIRDRDGAVHGFGCNQYGQLGDGTATVAPVPKQLLGLKNIKFIASSENSSAAYDASGNAWIWGGEKTTDVDMFVWSYFRPRPFTFGYGITGVTVTDLAVGVSNVIAVGSDKKIYRNSLEFNSTNYDVSSITTAKKVAAAGESYYCLLTNGTVRSWGTNNYGQLGSGNTNPRFTAAAVLTAGGSPPTALTGIIDIAAGPGYALFLGSDGKVRVTGLRSPGMGNGATGSNLYANAASIIPGLTTAAAIRSSGRQHNLARLTSGAFAVWGNNQFGVFGNGGTTNPNSVFTVPGVNFATTIPFGGSGTTSFYLNSNAVRSWGTNDYSQLGRGDFANLFTPPTTGGLTGFAFAAGNPDSTMFGLTPVTTTTPVTGGIAYAWGDLSRNSSGVWHPYLTQMGLRLTNNPPPAYDSDADGMPDSLELFYFGNLSANATDDPDGDGLSNIQELLAGTNPTSANTAATTDGLNDSAHPDRGSKPEVRLRFPGAVVIQDSSSNYIAVTASDPQDLVRTIVRLSDPAHGTITESTTSPYLHYGGFHYTPTPGYSGPDSFTIRADTLTNYQSNVATVDIRVDAIPVAQGTVVHTNEDVPVAIALPGVDSDGDSLTYHVVSQPSHGTLTGQLDGIIDGTPHLTYTPAQNYSNDHTPGVYDSFTYTVTDPSGATSTAGRIDLAVHNVDDDPPSLAAIQDFTVIEDTPTTLLVQPNDPDSNYTLAVTSSVTPHGTVSSIAGTQFVFSPGSNRFDDATFTATVSDGVNPAIPITVNIHMTAVNDLPVPVVKSASISQNSPAVSLQLEASDVDDTVLTYAFVSQSPTKGTLSNFNTSTGSFRFTPTAGATGNTTLTFSVKDPHSPPINFAFNISIYANAAPVVTVPPVTLYDSRSATVLPITATDDGNPQPLTATTTQPAYGVIGGTFPALTYTPDLTRINAAGASFNNSDSFNLSVTDGGLTTVKTVNITYAPIRPGFDPRVSGFNKMLLGRSDDSFSQTTIPFGFPVNFFGASYSSAFINNNGNICFTQQLRDYTPGDIVNRGLDLIAVFWGDVDTRLTDSEEATYGTTTAEGRPAFCVTWTLCGVYDNNYDFLNSFQMLLIDRSDVATGDFDVEFNYGQIQWDTGALSAGSPAHIGMGTASHKGLELYGSGISQYFLDTINAGQPNPTALIRTRNGSPLSTFKGRHIFAFRSGQPATAPQADAGPDKTVNVNTVTPASSGSSPTGDPVTYQWQEIDENGNPYADVNPATFSSSTVLQPQIALPVPRTYRFRFYVSDGAATSSDDLVVVRQ